MRPHLLSIVSLLFLSVTALCAQESKLLRQPTVSATQIAFVYANDLWVVERSGGMARRLTTAEGAETEPRFSPDGKWIAFTGQYDGNTDVYIVPSSGGEPKRLTYHPGGDVVRGWTLDGKYVFFNSPRTSAPVGYPRLWKISVDGGMPEPMPMRSGVKLAFSPDGKHAAYVPFAEANAIWRNYRGGRATPVWIVNLSTLDVEKIPRDKSNDTDPIWIGENVYFTSDRNGAINLFSYNTSTKAVKELTQHTDYDIRSASGGAGAIVYEQAGTIHL